MPVLFLPSILTQCAKKWFAKDHRSAVAQLQHPHTGTRTQHDLSPTRPGYLTSVLSRRTRNEGCFLTRTTLSPFPLLIPSPSCPSSSSSSSFSLSESAERKRRTSKTHSLHSDDAGRNDQLRTPSCASSANQRCVGVMVIGAMPANW